MTHPQKPLLYHSHCNANPSRLSFLLPSCLFSISLSSFLFLPSSSLSPSTTLSLSFFHSFSRKVSVKFLGRTAISPLLSSSLLDHFFFLLFAYICIYIYSAAPIIALFAKGRRKNRYPHTHTCTDHTYMQRYMLTWYFIKLVFSGRQINESNVNLSWENTFLGVLLFKITDNPPCSRNSALGSGQTCSLGGSEYCVLVLSCCLALPRLCAGCAQEGHGVVSAKLRPHHEQPQWPERCTRPGISLL